MGFHNLIKFNMICQLCISINDTGKNYEKIQKEKVARNPFGIVKAATSVHN